MCGMNGELQDKITELVERARRGELSAFAELVRRFQDMACGYAYAVLGDFHLAQDAAQEAFVEAYRKLEQLREPERFAGWLRRIVFSCSHRMTRGKAATMAPLEAAEVVASGEPGPSKAAEGKELGERVLAAVRALPESQRTAVTLFYINGYSQKEIADFLEVPVTTVNNRLHAARVQLKERMMTMVEKTIKDNAPDERFSKRVIEQLLARPRPLEIPGHPVREAWDLIRRALPDYEVIEGSEVVDRSELAVVREDLDRTYHLDDQTALRTQMTVTTLAAVRSRQAPVRLMAAGRVFRPDPEDATHLKMHHQVDGIRIEAGVNVRQLKETLERVVAASVGPTELRWTECTFGGFVQEGYEVFVKVAGTWRDIAGCGLLQPQTLRAVGFDPGRVNGVAFGIGLERLAMIRHSIDDIRKLYEPPYVAG